MLPDLTDTEKMARIGRLTVLRQERRKAGQQLRDALIPILNNLEGERNGWDVSEITKLCERINELSSAIEHEGKK